MAQSDASWSAETVADELHNEDGRLEAIDYTSLISRAKKSNVPKCVVPNEWSAYMQIVVDTEVCPCSAYCVPVTSL